MEGPQCHLGSREPCDAFQELPGASGPAVVAAPHCKVVVDEIDEVQDETATVGEIQKEVLEDKGVVVVYTQVVVVLAEVGRDDVVQDSGVHHDSGKHLEVWLAQGVAYILVVDQVLEVLDAEVQSTAATRGQGEAQLQQLPVACRT